MRRLPTTLRAVARDFREYRLLEESASVAFFSLYSVFPVILVMLLISVQFDASSGFWQTWFSIINDTVPTSVLQWVLEYYEYSRENFRLGMFSLVFLSAFWLSTVAFVALLRALRRVMGLQRRNMVLARVNSVILIAVSYLTALVLVQLLAVGEEMIELAVRLNWISISTTLALTVLRWVIILTFSFAAVLAVYVVADGHPSHWREHVPGTWMFTGAWILVTKAMMFYYNRFDGTQEVFGAIASLIVMMSWILAIVLLLLVCARFNQHWLALADPVRATDSKA